MSKFLKRIGTIKVHYEIEILIESLDFPKSVNFHEGFLKISLKKGKRMVQTQNTHQILSTNSSQIIKETVIFKATLFFDKKNQKFLPKPVILTTTIQEKTRSKSFQMQEQLDFAQIVEKAQQLPLSLPVIFDDKTDKKPTLFLEIKRISCNKTSNFDESEENSSLSGLSRENTPYYHQRTNKSYDFKTQLEESLSKKLKKSRHNPSEILNSPPIFNEELIENHMKNKKKQEKNDENNNASKVFGKKQTNTAAIFPSSEDFSKEKEEFLDKILVLENTIQRKNELLQENLAKIKDLHQNEESLRLDFSQKIKETSKKNKALCLEIDSLREKNSQLTEISLENQREIQRLNERNALKEKEIAKISNELSLQLEENQRLREINQELTQGNQEQTDFFKDFHAFNEKIKNLYEENHILKGKIQEIEEEVLLLNSQKEFLYNQLEKNKQELEETSRKSHENEEIVLFYKTSLKKTEESLASLRKEIKSHEFAKEEALSKQTSLLIELQNLKFKINQKNSEIFPTNINAQAEELLSLQEDNVYLKKENQLLQKKLELLMLSLSEEKEENQEICEKFTQENELLRKDLNLSEKRRLELEKELIQMSRSSKTFIINDEFDSLKRTLAGKMAFYQEKIDAFEEKTKGLNQENQELSEALAKKIVELKTLQMKEQSSSEKSPINLNYNSVNNEVLKEKDQIILTSYEKIKDLMAENKGFQDKCEEFRIKEGELELEISRLEVEKQKSDKKLAAKEQENHQILQEIHLCKEESRKLHEEMEGLREKVRFLERERGLKEEKLAQILVKAIEIGGNELVDRLTGAI